MKHIDYTQLNKLLFLNVKGQDTLNTTLHNFFSEFNLRLGEEKEVVICFSEFIKAQLDAKVISAYFQDLVTTSLYLVRLNQNQNYEEIDISVIKSVSLMLREFIKCLIPVCMFIYYRFNNLRIILEVPRPILKLNSEFYNDYTTDDEDNFTESYSGSYSLYDNIVLTTDLINTVDTDYISNGEVLSFIQQNNKLFPNFQGEIDNYIRNLYILYKTYVEVM